MSDCIDDFLVQVGLHQGSILSPLLFITVLENDLNKLGQDVQKKCFMLMTWHYADEEMKGRLEAWKGACESNGLTVKVMKTKMMIRKENTKNATVEGKFHCVVSSV